MRLSSLARAVTRFLLKKERVGWSFAGKYYRLRRPALVMAFACIDILCSLVFFFKKRRLTELPESILVIQLDHIGDMVLCSSLIQQIRKTYPTARITVLIRELADEIARAIPGINEILHLHTPWLSREKAIGWIGVLRFCFQRFRSYDLAFEVHGESRNTIIAFLLSRFRVGMGVRGLGFLLNKDVPWIKNYSSHIIEVQGKLLSALAGKEIPPVKPVLSIPISAEENVTAFLSPLQCLQKDFILLQMSSGERNKEWPVSNWKTFAAFLLGKGYTIICADKDPLKTSELAGSAAPGNPIYFFQASLLEYAALIRRARCLITVDTFTSHIASCFDTPTLVLYPGVSFKEEWGPYCGKKLVLQDTSCSFFPCSLRSCPIAFPSPCMQAISVERALEQAMQLLEK